MNQEIIDLAASKWQERDRFRNEGVINGTISSLVVYLRTLTKGLFALKYAGVIQISWWRVFAPWLLALVIGWVGVILFLIFLYYCALVQSGQARIPFDNYEARAKAWEEHNIVVRAQLKHAELVEQSRVAARRDHGFLDVNHNNIDDGNEYGSDFEKWQAQALAKAPKAQAVKK